MGAMMPHGGCVGASCLVLKQKDGRRRLTCFLEPPGYSEYLTSSTFTRRAPPQGVGWRGLVGTRDVGRFRAATGGRRPTRPSCGGFIRGSTNTGLLPL